ncbi:MAG: alpha-helical ferredoxin [Verrucomicrobiaceae bacterium]|nr:alpha-helical ferredoxin [Verrucomicrobiaceae bacterium]
MSDLNLHLKVWRQTSTNAKGHFQDIEARDIPDHASFLEMMDIVNERLIATGGEPVAFDHDCREGICGACSMVINGVAHGPEKATTTCQLHMRKFRTGDTIWVEPFRARAFPVQKDLMVDRSAFDRIAQAGGFISVRTGAPQDANALPIGKDVADEAMDAAACIACGACVAACPNASAMLFVSSKLGQLNVLPQGQPEKTRRSLGMVRAMDAAGFGNCTNHYECEAVCPKEIKRDWIAKMNRDFMAASAKEGVVGLGNASAGGE